MKKILIYAFAILSGAVLFTSCSEDDLSPESIITVDQVDYTEFDQWLKANFINTYNIDLKYRFQDIETDHDYYLIPADYNQSIKLAHIIKYAVLEAFDEAAGINFTRGNFPKQIYLVGNWEYRNNGTFVLGTAEGGKKVFLAGVNLLDENLSSIASLNEYYLKTVYHEFTHILNQTKDYAADYQLITATDYVAGEWSEAPYNASSYYLEHGFISAYAQHSHGEDFAEMFSLYVTNTPEQWDAWMETAGTDGANHIASKLSSVRDYMEKSWGIDMDELRDIVLRREADIVAGKIDLSDLTVK
ncbi:putative zinc-binding metallopeptidase [Prevotella sp. KH2C16]|uniref:zinc-binding metallopeptidase n=1 Tax=Prevotella sp. KH2C16 TaxID=1855325 RepID=UPI0008ED821E|nr:putative zinc-binding metallopeptidase [Prevotella sp. KH2C16]SFG04108.1 substrate import-associated zinc metallohydrolase lipoprotein [Prevotella sp. KH2C16]